MTTSTLTIQITTAAIGTKLQFTSLAFRPAGIFVTWSGRSAIQATPAAHSISGGEGFFLANGKQGCISYYEQDNADPYTVGSGLWDTAGIVRQSGGATTGGKATLSTMLDNGFELEILEQFGAEIIVLCTCVSGVEFNSAEVTEPGATGVQTISGVGFRPTFAKVFGSGKTALNTPSADGDFCLGAASGSDADQNGVYALFRDSAQGFSDAASYCRRTECVAFLSTTQVVARASCNSFTDDGMELNWLERDSTRKMLVVFATGRWLVFPGETFNDLATNHDFTGMTWVPEGLMLYGFGFGDDVGASAESTQDVVSALSDVLDVIIGYGTGPTERFWNHLYGGGGSSTNDCGSSIGNTQIYLQQGASPGAHTDVTALMDLVGLTADTITVVMDDADAGAPSFWYGIAIGPPIIAFRQRLVRYQHNTYQSREAGRTLIRDVLGRTVPNHDVKPDNFMFSGGAGFITPTKFSSLIVNPATFYIESVQPTEDRVKIETNRESLIQSLFRRLGS